MTALLLIAALLGSGLVAQATPVWAAPVSRADALNSFQKSHRYTGGSTIGLNGKSLHLITRATIGGIEVRIVQKRNAHVQLTVPAFATARKVTIELFQGSAKRGSPQIHVPAASGTVANSLNTWQLSNRYAGGSTLGLTGVRLSQVTRASIGGIDVRILAKRGDYIQVLVPAFAAAGNATLVLYRGDSRVSTQTMRVPARAGSYVNSMNTWQLSNRYDNGHSISVTGVRLTAITRVTLAGTAAPILGRDAGQIRVTVPNLLGGGSASLVFWAGSTRLSTQTVQLQAPTVAFIGDSYSTATGVSSAAVSASALIAAELGWSVKNYASGGTGYGRSVSAPTAQRACGANYCRSYVEQLEQVAGQPDIVVVFGGRNEATDDPAWVKTGIDSFYARAQQRFPGAHVLAASPVWDASPVPTAMDRMRRSVLDAATANGARYVNLRNPLSGRTDAVTADRVHPNDAGHRLLARAFVTGVRAL